jgi:hypothetical protein
MESWFYLTFINQSDEHEAECEINHNYNIDVYILLPQYAIIGKMKRNYQIKMNVQQYQIITSMEVENV